MEGGIWGIIIVLSAFLIQLFVFGVTASIGVFNIELLDYFENDTVGVSLIAALNFGLFLGSGPIVSLAMTKFSFRKIAFFGSVLVTFGLIGSAVLPFIPAMCLCFGVLAGVGSSCLYLPSHVLSGLYYDKNRSLATGIATSGSGLGAAVMPAIVGFLIDTYTWKGAFVICAGLCLHCFVFSALLRSPPTPLSSGETDFSKKSCEETEHPLLENDPINSDITNGNVDVKREELNGTESLKSGADVGNREIEVDFSQRKALPSDYDYCDQQDFSIESNSQELKEPKKNIQATIAYKENKVPKTARHVYVFTSYSFCVYFVNNILWNITAAIIQSFLPEFLTMRGFSPIEAAWLFGAFGFGVFIGGIAGGVGGNFRCVNRILLFSVACMVMGVSIVSIPAFNHTTLYVLALIVSGIAFGILLGLLIIVLTDLIGVESLSNGLGYLMLSNGIGTFSGPPIAGFVQSATGRWDEAIYLSGILCIVAGFVMLMIPLRECFSKL